MNRLLTLIATTLLCINLVAQTPEAISYQAVLRNASNELLANTNVGMRISLLRAATDGPQVYAETHSTTTTASGLVSVEIGKGAVVSGDFTSIDWGADTYFIKTETDPEGGNNYSITGISQLLSVPYALHAKTADRVINGGFSIDVEVTDAEEYDRYDGDGGILINFIGGTPPYNYHITETGTSNEEFGQYIGHTNEPIVKYTELCSDYYEFYAEDANGLYVQRKIYVGHKSPIVNVTNIQPSCRNTATGSFSFTIEGGTPHYQYSVDGGSYLPYVNGGVTIENVWDYVNLEVKDAEGKVGLIYVNGKNDGENDGFELSYYKPNITLTSIDACNGTDGGIEVTIPAGTEGMPFSYKWYKVGFDHEKGEEIKDFVSSDKNLSNATVGYYVLEISNADGCQSEGVYKNIEQAFNPGFNTTQTCEAITIEVYGQTGTINYEWSDTEEFNTIVSSTNTLTGVESDKEYFLRMSNASGCVSPVHSFYLRSSFDSHVYENSKTRPCKGATNGSIDITVDYPKEETLTYEWATDSEFTNIVSSDEDLINVGAPEGGRYFLRLTNEDGCQSEAYDFWLEESEGFNADFSYTQTEACQGESNGSIDISFSNYEGTLSYVWAADRDFNIIVSNDEDLVNVAEGRYYLKVNNGIGCERREELYLHSFSVYTESYIQNASSPSSTDGSVQISISDGGNYSFEWATDWEFTNIISTEEDLNNVAAGQYYLRITDNENNGCSNKTDFSVGSN